MASEWDNLKKTKRYSNRAWYYVQPWYLTRLIISIEAAAVTTTTTTTGKRKDNEFLTRHDTQLQVQKPT